MSGRVMACHIVRRDLHRLKVCEMVEEEEGRREKVTLRPPSRQVRVRGRCRPYSNPRRAGEAMVSGK